MGYTHYWHRPKEISIDVFSRIVSDFKKLFPVLERAGVKLAGPFGEGEPEIDNDCVAFNGPKNCGHPEDFSISIPWPAPDAGGVFAGNPVAGAWFAGTLLATRTCPGDCSYETFYFPRVYEPYEWETPENGLFFQFCKTAFRPYDLAVTAFLIIAKRHCRRIVVATDGEDQHWFDAKIMCQMELGYGLGYEIRDGYLVKKR
ncbi:MAG: hypothetical protein ACPLTR_12460 [Thermacetogeniaceae bacterium]